jgi:beta-lactamase class A
VRRSALIAWSLAVLLCPALARAGGRVRYDVSYLWSQDFAKIEERKRAIGAALGPRVEKRLRVVQIDEGFSLIYPRRTSLRGARAAAAAHSRMLRRRGLGDAVPTVSRRWTIVSDEGVRSVPTAEQTRLEEAAEDAERVQLEKLVEDYVEELRRSGRLAPDERTAWSVHDFTTGEELVGINTDIKLQAASLIKPFVALAYLHEVKGNRQVYDAESRRKLERMIQHSDNTATNWVMRRLGGPAAVQSLLQDNYKNILGDIELVEYIPRGGRTYRNKASAGDYSRFLLALYRGELPGSDEIKRLMGLPKRDRVHTGVRLPEDTEVYSKTGSTSQLCGDMGMLLAKGPDGKQYAYTVIGLIEKTRPARNYFRWLRARGNVIRAISGLVSRRLSAIHGASPARAEGTLAPK